MSALPANLPDDESLYTEHDYSYAEKMAALNRHIEEVLRDTVEDNPFIPHKPLPKQAAFLGMPVDEMLYGGALASGKSDALLMASAQYVDRPHYRALLIRETLGELELPGALIHRSMEWWGRTGAQYNANKKRWKFPSGAEVWFGYLRAGNFRRYQSSEWDFIGYDELVTVPERDYTILNSRRRKNILHRDTADVPPRVRSASNPPVGRQESTGWWVKVNLVDKGWPHFIPADFRDNPYVDEGYLERLRLSFDPVTFAKLVHGDWNIRAEGGMFRRHWFGEPALSPPRELMAVSRGWDRAASKPSAVYPDPDWTAGVLVGRDKKGVFWILDVARFREESAEVAMAIKQYGVTDGNDVAIVLEGEPGASGKDANWMYQQFLSDFQVQIENVAHIRGGKAGRATPLAIQAKLGNVKMVKAPWNKAFLDELSTFGIDTTSKDDQVDGCSMAFNDVARKTQGQIGGSLVPAFRHVGGGYVRT